MLQATRPPARNGHKAADPLDDFYDSNQEYTLLFEILALHYTRMLVNVHELLLVAMPEYQFPLTDGALRYIQLEAATRVVRIDESTRQAIRQQLEIGYTRGYSIQQIALGVPREGYRGLDGLFTETWRYRPQTVARTEIQNAQLKASQERYVSSGVVRQMGIIDGTDDDDACRRRNGTRVPVGTHVELNHPNCVVTVYPIVEPEGAR